MQVLTTQQESKSVRGDNVTYPVWRQADIPSVCVFMFIFAEVLSGEDILQLLLHMYAIWEVQLNWKDVVVIVYRRILCKQKRREEKECF